MNPALRSKSLARATMILASLAVPSSPAAQTSRPVFRPGVDVTEVTTGRLDVLQPTATIANLDAGDLVAGTTWWEVEGVVWVETYVGFTWSPTAPTEVFEIPPAQYFNDNLQSPVEIADDGTVVGTNVFFQTLQNFPFRWTAADGFALLPTPAGGGLGGALGVSADGRVVGGFVMSGLFAAPQAARWLDGNLQVLGPAGSTSSVLDVSASGSVLVGELGVDLGSLEAVRWTGATETLLDPLAGQSASSARLTSKDGRFALGTATVGGLDLLVRWDESGSATAFAPPGSFGIQELRATNADASVVVGALAEGADWAPFVWSLADGFRVIDELGRPSDYDLSVATDVSEDGSRVVGALRSSVVSNGDPPTTGFLWTAAEGTQALDDVLTRGGGTALGIFDATAIAGDGSRILATGVVRPSIFDTTAVLIELDEGRTFVRALPELSRP